jgi:hypothetical protein
MRWLKVLRKTEESRADGPSAEEIKACCRKEHKEELTDSCF